KRDWESKVCPVCKSEKWKNSPFCRSCSIKIQRKHLFWVMGRTGHPREGLPILFKRWTGNSLLAMFRRYGRRHEEQVVYAWLCWYDRCRDYLGTRRRFGIQTFRDSAVSR